jgi:glycosyltransferase involved in cell wall biosynthesis
MDRLLHLKQTYSRNLDSCPDAEFILIDYGSNDGLESWVREELSDHLSSGRLKFFRTNEPIYFHASHAKNIAHKLASGDILCNLDSDIFVPKGFSRYIQSVFESNPLSIIAFESDDSYGNQGCAGIVISRRDHFYSVNGYDEDIREGWGYDDMNFQFRCRMQNSLKLFVPPKMCFCIPHPNEIRTKNFPNKDIHKTMKISMELCEKAALKKDYIANKNRHWGKCLVFKNFSLDPIEL